MNENNIAVAVPVEAYTKLVSRAERYDILLNALIQSSELNYNKEDLSVSSYAVAAIIRASEPELYAARIRQLKNIAEPQPDATTINPL